MSVHPYQERLQRCTELMKAAELDALLLTKPANLFYLTGDGRLCAYAMITQEGEVALGVPSTDVEDVTALAHFEHIVGFEDEVGMIHSIAHYFQHFDIQKGTVGLEYSFLPQPRMGMLTHPHGKPRDVVAKDCTPLMSELRLVKDSEEIERIRAAVHVADVGMKAAIEAVKPGMTESQVAAVAEFAMRQQGATDFYRSYVASGPRTSIAHGVPTLRKIQSGDLVMIDLHPVVGGYSADVGRTVCLGKPTVEQQEAFDLYVKGLDNAIGKVKAGVGMMDIQEAMHGVYKAAGHGDHIFGPPIHGLGIEFEEAPLPAGHAFFHGEKAPTPLAAGVVIAIGNCGLYLGHWGVRVEDTVVVGLEGPLVLSHYPRQLKKQM